MGYFNCKVRLSFLHLPHCASAILPICILYKYLCFSLYNVSVTWEMQLSHNSFHRLQTKIYYIKNHSNGLTLFSRKYYLYLLYMSTITFAQFMYFLIYAAWNSKLVLSCLLLYACVHSKVHISAWVLVFCPPCTCLDMLGHASLSLSISKVLSGESSVSVKSEQVSVLNLASKTRFFPPGFAKLIGLLWEESGPDHGQLWVHFCHCRE